jgi:predicted small metal-binding protein
MSKVMQCRSVGVDCDFEAHRENEAQVMAKIAEHARTAHGMEKIPADMAAKVRAAIHDE